MKKITLLFLLLGGIVMSQAQHTHTHSHPHVQKCGTDEFTADLIANNPEYHQKFQETQALFQNLEMAENKQKTSGIVYTIPVVFHIIYNDYRDNISRLQIEDGLRVLNEDFRRMNADASNTRAIFQGVAADVEIEFKLAKKDPNGNCTEGITRTQSSQSINAHDNVKSLINWDNSKYLNIWVVNSIDPGQNTGVILGYAYFPVIGTQNFVQDGMVIRHDQVGTIGTALTSSVSNASVHQGRTITHEAGHYLGVPHTFQGGCFSGDGFSDTPPVSSANDGCDFATNTCTNDNPDLPDMIENYMDYSDGACQNMWTDDQTFRMRLSLQNTSLRMNLRQSTNLDATGVTNSPNCASPVAIMETDKDLICVGESIDFFDASEDGDPTSWNWTFPGGTPATSTQANPTVTYNVAGNYDVTLAIGTGGGNDTTVYSRRISVKNPGSTAFYPNWTDDFENISIPSPEITILDEGDGIAFELFTQAGSSGTQSLKLDNFSATVDEETDEIISPAISTIFTQNLSLSFDYAFAAKENANDDELNVYASTDCGQTWVLRRFYRGNQLRTVSNTTQPFTPSGASEWDTKTISFNAYVGPDPLLIKIEFIAGGGNNFYVDNIRFTGTIGLDEYHSNLVSLYPNPAKSLVKISSASGFDLNNSTLSFSDITGKQIFSMELRDNTSEYQIDLDQYNLLPGVYLISISNDQNQKAFKKLVIE